MVVKTESVSSMVPLSNVMNSGGNMTSFVSMNLFCTSIYVVLIPCLSTPFIFCILKWVPHSSFELQIYICLYMYTHIYIHTFYIHIYYICLYVYTHIYIHIYTTYIYVYIKKTMYLSHYYALKSQAYFCKHLPDLLSMCHSSRFLNMPQGSQGQIVDSNLCFS